MTMSLEQAKLNLRFAKHLEKLPREKFSMKSWGYHLEGCGTACCIAGNAARWEPYKVVWYKPKDWSMYDDDSVAEAMGLTSYEAANLFLNDWSGRDFEKITPREAANAIRKLVYIQHPSLKPKRKESANVESKRKKRNGTLHSS